MRFRLATGGGGNQAVADGFGRGMQSLFQLPLLQAQAAEQAQAAGAKRALIDAQTRHSDAEAALAAQKAEAERQQLERGGVGELLNTALASQGVPLHQIPEASRFVQTGQLDPRYAPPASGVGPTLPTPAYADPAMVSKAMQALGLTRQALTVGDKSVENIAKATGAYQDQAITDQAVGLARAGDDMGMSRLNAVRGKKEFTPYAAVGTTGTALNQVTGDQTVSNQGLRVLFGDVQGANIARDKAAAASSYASAAQHRASERKTLQELEQGARTGDIQLVPSQDGSLVAVNKRTMEVRPLVGADGKPVIRGGSAGGGGKPLTEGQAKANLFGGRMMEADAILNEMEDKGVVRPGNIKGTTEAVLGLTPFVGEKLADMGGTLTNWTQSSAQQQVEQARRDFINAVLRRESGAVISPQEFANAEKQYFPQPNDTKEQLAQKRRARAIATTLMLQEVPEAQRYKLGQVPRNAPPAAPPNQPTAPEGSWGAPTPSTGWSITRVN